MARMAVEIMGGSELSVLVYGPGRSLDYRHIGALDKVRRAAVGDLMKLVEDADWVDLAAPVTDRFDLLIACEVVEHFTDPPADFAQLFSHVTDDGLVVCSTNIYDGTDLKKHDYVFIKGHTSYYSPRSIARIAKENGFYIDFRVPLAATTTVGPRKRYVLFSRSIERMQDVALYFGRNLYAPSER
ncbi:class I SAM-dependent methyltransferase [Rhizohabitans arisaemae]|uniref:class I SAM-dependent methyltransferase n=1 Tax=Rhizohabitans arisaemae TaxID=2720610 RepID=UPI0024B16F0E|nr:class I SAM-dependent methyltransferase [Rhizohabitans arisaemae]